MFLMRFTLELPNRVLQHFILSQSMRDSLEFMKLSPIAQSQNIPLIEFLTLPITVSGEGDGSTTEATENELNTVSSEAGSVRPGQYLLSLQLRSRDAAGEFYRLRVVDGVIFEPLRGAHADLS
ncbi:hypothetical protein VitviT2T_028360 [Vitis vinifera]|uniref:Uncharacterized protein n=1 Tax=Vitis vinifera TaxID=29760 RepID=A0ABY9DT18_VITVI|nr:hypothetical protein VitviT2T_028360 [Vitis vinifera]